MNAWEGTVEVVVASEKAFLTFSKGAGFAIGLIAAIVYAASWSKGRSTTLKTDPRIKNLLWLLGGFLGFLVADLKPLGSTFDKTELVIAYLVGLALAPFIMAFGWWRDATSLQPDVVRAFGASPFFYGLRNGHAAFQKRADQVRAQVDAARDDLKQVLLISSRASQRVIRCASFEDTVGGILADACDLMGQIIPPSAGTLDANIMMRASPDELRRYAEMWGKPVDEVLKFAWKGLKWQDSLVLVHYGVLPQAARRDPRPFALPIPCEKTYGGPEMNRIVLAGAPRAIVDRTAQVVRCDRPELPELCPRSTRSEIEKFLRNSLFKSFASAPILGSGSTHVAVLNINSPDISGFGDDDDPRQRAKVVDSLMPICSTLSIVIDRLTWLK